MGILSAHALTGDSRRIALRVELPLVADDSARTWIQVAIEGEWSGHPSGPFEFTRDVFGSILATFEAQANPIPLTYEHDSAAGQPRPAAGWIHDLEIREDGLWAEVELTERAAEMVRAGEYRFCSVVVWFDASDRATGEEHGPELLEVGLTNTPFLDGMQPIALTRSVGKEQTTMTQKTTGLRALMNELTPAADALAELKAKLGLTEDAGMGDLWDALYALTEMAGMAETLDALAGTAPAEPAAASDTPEGDVIAAADAPEDVTDLAEGDAVAADETAMADAAAAVDLIAQAMGTDLATATAALSERVEDIAAMLAAEPDGTQADAAAEDVSMTAASATVATLSRQVRDRDDELSKLRDEVRDIRLSARLDAAISAGHILDDERDFLMRLGRVDHGLLDERLASAESAPAVPQAVTGRAAPGDEQREETTAQHFDLSTATSAQRASYKMALSAGIPNERAAEIALSN